MRLKSAVKELRLVKIVQWNRSKSEILYSPGVMYTEQGSFESVRNFSMPLKLDVNRMNQSNDFYPALSIEDLEPGHNFPIQ